ncbi:uncharacterized protein EI90DRAFT_3022925 [Cantharellus anzutake]|uniref:uncharacterized protein n=1 Tax=Cantharellus anzutake TaxID=1750568 RepID=UPI001906DB19|nr:uncharacterized protein EI90DRAFT_3022925 [Cantharellus anzutake]KAF8312605.1 hypothetical protein EI90DRAFT_3022925 [Cantharellus anzutake]
MAQNQQARNPYILRPGWDPVNVGFEDSNLQWLKSHPTGNDIAGGEAVIGATCGLSEQEEQVEAGYPTASEKINVQGTSHLPVSHMYTESDTQWHFNQLTSCCAQFVERAGAGDLTSPEKAEVQDTLVSWHSADAEMPLSPHGTSGEMVTWTILDPSQWEEWVWPMNLAGPEWVEVQGASESRHSEMLRCPQKSSKDNEDNSSACISLLGDKALAIILAVDEHTSKNACTQV